MGTLRRIWGSWSTRRRVLTVGAIVLAFAGVAVAGYLVLKRPGDISDPDAEFVETDTVKIPKRSELKTTDWPTYQLNPERTGYLPGKYLDPPFGSSKWSLPLGHLIEHAPIVVGDRMYILDLKGILYAVDKRNGKIIYKKDLGELSAAAPGYHDGMVYAINLDPDQIVALRAKDGKELWRKPIGSPGSESSPVVVNDRLIFGCQCGSVYALNPKTGATLWQTETAGEIKSAVAYHEGTIFGSNYGGEFFAIDASDGGVKWTTPIIGGAFGRGGGSYSTPAIAYGRVYVGALDSRVYSLDIDSGEIAWTFSTGAEVYPGPVVADVKGAPPSVYIASADAQAYALDAKSGALRWKRSVGDQVIGSGVVIGSTFYVSRASEQGMVGFNAASGKQVFTSDLGAYSPAISDGERFYLVGYGTVRAFESRRLEEKKAKENREIKKAKKKAERQAEGVAPAAADTEGEEPEG
ncbi:MAG TPA: PQQ-binding-like beta-propeller repeat protein [Solirubrobacterales bacterium]|nr:PQQ-binding-like beta-propeller repeat protein [Solirubrobacterales bacterium]